MSKTKKSCASRCKIKKNLLQSPGLKADSPMAQHRPQEKLSTGDSSCTGQCRTTTCCWDRHHPRLTWKNPQARRRKLNPQWNTESCLSSHRRSPLVFGLLETQFPSSVSAVDRIAKKVLKKTSIACFKLREQMKHLIKVVNYIPRWEITWKSQLKGMRYYRLPVEFEGNQKLQTRALRPTWNLSLKWVNYALTGSFAE